MIPKLFSTVIVLVTLFQAGAQTLSKLPVENVDTSHTSVLFRCHAGRTNAKNIYPLFIIDGKRFKNADMSNIFIGISNIDSINVFKNRASRRKYGRGSKDGVVIVKTKTPVKWVSFKDLSIKYAEHPGVKNDLLFIIDGKHFTSAAEFYIDAGYIKSVNLRVGTNEMYNGKNYNSIANIELKK